MKRVNLFAIKETKKQ